MKQGDSQKGQSLPGKPESGPGVARASDPSPWVVRFAGFVPPGARVLDLACGAGRHSRLLLGLGFQVLAVDRDTSRLGDLAGRAGMETRQCDLETGGTPGFLRDSFDAIVVTNYLYRPLMPALLTALGPGGLLIYETFALGNEKFGRPSNPDFLLRPGELLDWLRGDCRILGYEDLEVTEPKPAAVQRICARRHDDAQNRDLL